MSKNNNYKQNKNQNSTWEKPTNAWDKKDAGQKNNQQPYPDKNNNTQESSMGKYVRQEQEDTNKQNERYDKKRQW